LSVRVLVVNAGSSSLKLAAFDDDRQIESATVEEWQGEEHLDPLRDFLDGVDGIDAIGHRVVHGGSRLTESVLVDDDVVDYLLSIRDLAPLHNPRAVAGIRALRELRPGVPEVACFDTTFHAGLPLAARTYALPREWNQRWGLRRYGFHGLSHAHAVRRAAEIVARPLEDLRIVSCHLGAGASLAAVRHGSSVDTTMGFTPVEGLVMATRSGSVDPGLLLWLLDQGRVSRAELAEVLEHGAGLKGLSETSGDLREVMSRRAAGDPDATLAHDVFVHRLRREIGAMAASAGGIDVLVMTGGIGEHSAQVRAGAAAGLGWLGVALDHDANEAGRIDSDISTPDAAVRTIIVAASEESEIARETRRLVGRG
jgi:acetate kinase